MNSKNDTYSDRAPRKMLRRHEAALYLGLSESFLAKAAVYGTGPIMVKAGRVVLYDPADLDEWTAARKVSSTSEVTDHAV